MTHLVRQLRGRLRSPLSVGKQLRRETKLYRLLYLSLFGSKFHFDCSSRNDAFVPGTMQCLLRFAFCPFRQSSHGRSTHAGDDWNSSDYYDRSALVPGCA